MIVAMGIFSQELRFRSWVILGENLSNLMRSIFLPHALLEIAFDFLVLHKQILVIELALWIGLSSDGVDFISILGVLVCMLILGWLSR